jgi:alpha-tubulin suppressor-like RCC1 family protein
MPNNFLINGTDLESTYLTDWTIVDAAAYSGTTYTWGGNQDGQLGVNSIATSYPNTWIGFIATSAGWIQAEAANNFTMAIQPTAQFGPAIAIYHTGNNIFSQAGDGATTKRSLPTLLNQATTDDRIKMISAKSMGCCSIWNNGRLYAWGRNLYGEVGDDGGEGIKKPIYEFLSNNQEWKIIHEANNNNGLIILAK